MTDVVPSTRIVQEHGGTRIVAMVQPFPKDKLKFEIRTLRVDVTLVAKLHGADEVERVEHHLTEALKTLRGLGVVNVKYDVL